MARRISATTSHDQLIVYTLILSSLSSQLTTISFNQVAEDNQILNNLFSIHNDLMYSLLILQI